MGKLDISKTVSKHYPDMKVADRIPHSDMLFELILKEIDHYRDSLPDYDLNPMSNFEATDFLKLFRKYISTFNAEFQSFNTLKHNLHNFMQRVTNELKKETEGPKKYSTYFEWSVTENNMLITYKYYLN